MDVLEVGKTAKIIIDYGITIVISGVFITLSKNLFSTIIKKFSKLDKLDGMADFEGMCNNIENNSAKLDVISRDLDEMERRSQATTVSIFEAILNDRNLSNRDFVEYCIAVNGKFINKSILLINAEIDENGLSQKSRMDMLRDNITTIIDKSKIDIKYLIIKLKYNEDKVECILKKYDVIYFDFIKKLKDELLSTLAYSELEKDAMYIAFKNKLKNKIYKLNQKLDEVVKLK